MKRICVVLLYLFLSNSVFAQKGKFEAGMVAGPNYAILFGNYLLNKFAHPKLGFSGGLNFQYHFNNKFSLASNTYFERKGFMTEFKHEIIYRDSIRAASNGSTYSHANYISIPILARLNFGKKTMFFVNAGPYCSYLLSWKESHHISTPDINDPAFNASYYYDHTEKFRRFDFGISAGAGFQLPIQENYTLTLEARNNLGLVNISAWPVIDDKSIKNFSGTLLFGLNYTFKTE